MISIRRWCLKCRPWALEAPPRHVQVPQGEMFGDVRESSLAFRIVWSFQWRCWVALLAPKHASKPKHHSTWCPRAHRHILATKTHSFQFISLMKQRKAPKLTKSLPFNVVRELSGGVYEACVISLKCRSSLEENFPFSDWISYLFFVVVCLWKEHPFYLQE